MPSHIVRCKVHIDDGTPTGKLCGGDLREDVTVRLRMESRWLHRMEEKSTHPCARCGAPCLSDGTPAGWHLGLTLLLIIDEVIWFHPDKKPLKFWQDPIGSVLWWWRVREKRKKDLAEAAEAERLLKMNNRMFVR